MRSERKLPHERFGGGFNADSGDRVEAKASGKSHRKNAKTRAVDTDLASKITAVLHSAAAAANDQVMTRVLDAYADRVTSPAWVSIYLTQ